MTVLVAYATSRGSTQGIAERIVAGLERGGVAAEAGSVSDRPDVSAYDAVVLGSAVHGGKWLPAGSQFGRANSVLLAQRPVWLFSVSTVGDEEGMFPSRISRRLAAMRKETPEIAALRTALHAREHRNFAGVIARSDWPAVGRAFFRLMGGRYGDHRNWSAIDAWAGAIAADLRASWTAATSTAG